jgi:ATP/maltotriose-dependent transcriptional regulator MalT
MANDWGATADEGRPLAPGRWPLVGRQAEVDLVTAALDDPHAAGVVLAGPAGVGKTRLARAARDLARHRGWATDEVTATRAAASIPLGAFSHLLPAEPEPGAGGLADLLARATLALVRRGDGDRIVVVIDDAHLLDDASAALVHRLAKTPEVFVVVTVRTREAAPDAVVALWKDELALRLDVEPLAEEATADLLRAVLEGGGDRTLVHRIWEITRGNALYVRELLLSGLESGALRSDGGVWRWQGTMGAGARLQELVEGRLGRLPDEERRALEIAAFGEPVGVSLLEALAGIDAVDALERRQLLLVHREEKREFAWVAHPLYAEALRAGMPTRRAAAVQRQLADALEAAGARRREDALRIALWRLDGGGDVDSDALVAAAEQAEAAFDHALAERLARAALEAGGGTPAHMALGRALWQQGRAHDAEGVLAQLSDLVIEPAARVEVAGLRSLNLFFQLGLVDEAEAVLADVRARVPSAGPAVLAQQGVFRLYEGRPGEATEAAEAVLADDSAEPADRVVAAITLGPALAVAGDTAGAIAAVDEALPIALGLPLAHAAQLAGQLLAGRFLGLTLAGRLVEAEDLASITHQLALERHSHDGVAAMSCALGQVALMRGQVATAARWLREAAALLREQDRSGFLPWALGELAVAAAHLGDPEEAAAAIAEADAERRDCLRLFEVELELGRAWAAAAAGRQNDAVSIALAAADWAEESGQRVFAGLAFHAAARLGAPDRAAGRLTDLAAATDSALMQAMALHGAALAGADPARLEEASAAFEAIAALLLAAEAAAQAAAAHRTAGRTSSATRAAERARALQRQCEGAQAPALGGLEDAIPLTRREREVAQLAADGMASREIAERLFLSVRTVDNHLHRAYYKLGVSSRSELASALADPLRAE